MRIARVLDVRDHDDDVFPQQAGERTLGPACVLLSRASNQLGHRCCCFGLHAWDHMGVLLQRERGGLVA